MQLISDVAEVLQGFEQLREPRDQGDGCAVDFPFLVIVSELARYFHRIILMIVIVIVIVVVIVILILVLILIVARRGRNENAEYRHAVGVVNFFNATIAPDPPAARKSDRFVSFDITKLARKLCASGRLKDRAVVTLVPAGVPAADARPIMGAVTLVEQ